MLKARADGGGAIGEKRTPQAGDHPSCEISFSLAFDMWMRRNFPEYVRAYADDAICHCRTKKAMALPLRLRRDLLIAD